jgi:putative membrane protein
MEQNGEHNSDLLKGAVTGLIGGLIASWVMNQAQPVLSKASSAVIKEAGGKPLNQQQSKNGDDATVKTAESIVEPILGRSLRKEEKKSAGPIVHYVFGSLMGAVYGVASEVLPGSRKWLGLPYGAALFVAADEVAVSALGLSGPPSEVPIEMHVYGFMSHLVYAASLEIVRRSLRRFL